MGDMTSFNIDNGYFEGLVRGYRSGILRKNDYHNLVECETLDGMFLSYTLVPTLISLHCQCPIPYIRYWDLMGDNIINLEEFVELCFCFLLLIAEWQLHNFSDLKLHLQGTDYGPLLANDPSPLIVQTIDERLKERLVHEFTHIRNQCVEPLAQFLDYMTYGLVLVLLSRFIHEIIFQLIMTWLEQGKIHEQYLKLNSITARSSRVDC